MTMDMPPFKLAQTRDPVYGLAPARHHAEADAAPSTISGTTGTRRRLADLDGHLHCSVIGTCLGTAELRQLMSRHHDVKDADDLAVHHEAVRLVAERGALAKTLQKALDRKHVTTIARAARLRGDAALAGFWKESLRVGDVPGAYWALLTHREADVDLITKIFGDVHMLSHLVGSSNRADLRRLFAVEESLAAQKRHSDALYEQYVRTVAERDHEITALKELLAEASPVGRPCTGDDSAATTARLTGALRAARAEADVLRERGWHWECSAAEARAESDGLRNAGDALRRVVAVLEQELASIETQLIPSDTSTAGSGSSIADHLRGRRILYVGGRPGSTQAIRDLVARHGGEFRSHDGGLEDRKGLLAPAIAASDLVVFPVDCIDHDSADSIKRLCGRSGISYIPLRSAGVASFTAAVAADR